MINKKLALTLLFIFLSSTATFAYDFYPELGMDPFYSELNPNNSLEDTEPTTRETLINYLKKEKKTEEQKIKEKELKAKKKLDKKLEKEKIKEEKRLAKEKEKELKAIQKREEELKEFESYFDEEELEEIKKLKEEAASFSKMSDAEKAKALEKEDKERNQQTQEDKNFNLREKFSIFKSDKTKIKKQEKKDPQVEIYADFMEYFPDRYEVEAIGNARVNFKKEGVILSANKIIFNYDRNILKANDNVVLTASGSITEGDFIRIDLSKPQGFFENPVTTTEDIKLSAKSAHVFSDRIEEYDGVAKILKNEVLAFSARSFASYIDHSGVTTENEQKKKAQKGIYNLKAKTIYIDSKKDHEVITIKNADLYLKNHKIAAIPSARIVTNKENTVVESNIPEFGTMKGIGMHAGPAVVLNIPGGNTLKLAPILTYGDSKYGFGAIGAIRTPYGVTEMGYGTSEENFVLKGKMKLAPGLRLDYSRLTNQSEWFLGARRPKYSTQLSYTTSDYIKDLKLKFAQKYSAGLFVDNRIGEHLKDAEGRFRWMTQTTKSLYSYKNEEGNISFNFGLVAQTAATVYTTGDVTGIFRFGPRVGTKVGPWSQNLIYYQTGTTGETPFRFDRYRYGRSNLMLIESLRICKYLSVGYLASLAMNSDYKQDSIFQENRFLVSLGPDYARLTIGYDARRQNTRILLTMLVNTKNSEIEFDKAVLNNPEKYGKKQVKKKEKKKNYKKYLKDLK